MQNQESPTRNAAREGKQGEGDAIRGHREVAEAETQSPEKRMSTEVNSQPDDDQMVAVHGGDSHGMDEDAPADVKPVRAPELKRPEPEGRCHGKTAEF